MSILEVNDEFDPFAPPSKEEQMVDLLRAALDFYLDVGQFAAKHDPEIAQELGELVASWQIAYKQRGIDELLGLLTSHLPDDDPRKRKA